MFFRVKFFGKQAENIVKWFTKGKEIMVEGALDQEKFKDQQGNDVEIVVVKGFRWEFLGGGEKKKKDEDTGSGDGGGGIW
jgi:single-stranded DNA-binding protein